MSTATSVASRTATEQTLQWLALGLTPGLGPTRVRHLVEHFGSVAAIFRASLTDPPLLLYVRGDAKVLSQPGIVVVGTRHPTPSGSGMAERLSIDLVAHGLAIFSGMARGVDTAAHRGAVAAKGKTAAVFGTGVDVLYPKENSRPAEQILALGGALISEFPLGTFAAPQNFPIRNRIISGMSIGVLVVEAAEYSGTRITARCALGRIAMSSPSPAT